MSPLLHPVSRRGFLAGAAATGALIMLHPFSARAEANQAHLRIMETTDIHVNVLPYDYYADKANDTMGLSRTASLIDAVRKEAVNSMLIDNGDLLQGNPMGDYVAYEKGLKDGDLHPIMRYVIVIAAIAFFLIWDGLYNQGRYLDISVRELNHVVRYVTGKA